MSRSSYQTGVLRGHHVLIGVSIFFGIIFAVNGVFLFYALATHTGLISQQPYRKGLNYNKRIAAEERQKTAGWTDTLEIDTEHAELRLLMADRYGRPVSGLEIKGFIGRPSTEQHDVALDLVETGKHGTYTAGLQRLADGNWMVQLEARQQADSGTEVVYRTRKRIWLKR
ncbi:MAG: FixH family protein [Hyphomicrobiaceae bacterium]